MLCLRILHVCKRAGDTFTNMMFHNHFGVNDIKCVTGNSKLTHDMYSHARDCSVHTSQYGL